LKMTHTEKLYFYVKLWDEDLNDWHPAGSYSISSDKIPKNIWYSLSVVVARGDYQLMYIDGVKVRDRYKFAYNDVDLDMTTKHWGTNEKADPVTEPEK
ncbi:MAG: hypothetical protein QF535_20075, partial [Anaerolineales bacterium]|nr:hypothetical protein [Anaerolineales bacterium]